MDTLLDASLDSFLDQLLDEANTVALRTGIRGAVACLLSAGYLVGDEAVAYATVLGADEVDPLLVLELGTRRGAEALTGPMKSALDSPEGQPGVRRAIGDLSGALDRLEAKHDQPGQAPDQAAH